MQMSTHETSVDVAVPVRDAYNQWTQFETFPEFMNGVEAITQTDPTHTHWKIRIGGVSREFDAVITEQTPDERVAWKSVDGAGHGGVVTFHRLGDTQTRVMLQLDTEPQGIVEKAGEAVGLVGHQIKSDLDRFKDFIETRAGGADGGWRGEVPQDLTK
jgi:uncharacterized membrane protein